MMNRKQVSIGARTCCKVNHDQSFSRTQPKATSKGGLVIFLIEDMNNAAIP